MTTPAPTSPTATLAAAGATPVAAVPVAAAPAASAPAAAAVAAIDPAIAATLQQLVAALNATNLTGVALSDAVAQSLAPPVAQAPTINPRYQLVGPWEAGVLYGIIPLQPLMPVLPDTNDKWYAITCGKYVGLTHNSAISLAAVTGVSQGLHNHYLSQTVALAAFNGALAAFAVEVIL
ncbi:hypothetical protein C8J57DRAFT_1246520 [Mycena rebaudengoi]|nr:hypothetical protein C8J57DRAFT_1246520 [Mycena rebaudengoi]